MWWWQALASRSHIYAWPVKSGTRATLCARIALHLRRYVRVLTIRGPSIALGGSRRQAGVARCIWEISGQLNLFLKGCQVTRWAHTSLSLAVSTKISGQSNLFQIKARRQVHIYETIYMIGVFSLVFRFLTRQTAWLWLKTEFEMNLCYVRTASKLWRETGLRS